MKIICWLALSASCVHGGVLYESLEYISQPEPVWAEFTIQGERLLSFESSYTAGTFSIEIPGAPETAIIDSGVIAVYGGLREVSRHDRFSPGFINGGWTSNVFFDYNGEKNAILADAAMPSLILAYRVPGKITGFWDVTYGWPGTDMDVFGAAVDSPTKIRDSATVQFWMHADVAVRFHSDVPEPASLGYSIAALCLLGTARVCKRYLGRLPGWSAK